MIKFGDIGAILGADKNIANAIPMQAMNSPEALLSHLQVKMTLQEARLLLEGIRSIRTACHRIEHEEITGTIK